MGDPVPGPEQAIGRNAELRRMYEAIPLNNNAATPAEALASLDERMKHATGALAVVKSLLSQSELTDAAASYAATLFHKTYLKGRGMLPNNPNPVEEEEEWFVELLDTAGSPGVFDRQRAQVLEAQLFAHLRENMDNAALNVGREFLIHWNKTYQERFRQPLLEESDPLLDPQAGISFPPPVVEAFTRLRDALEMGQSLRREAGIERDEVDEILSQASGKDAKIATGDILITPDQIGELDERLTLVREWLLSHGHALNATEAENSGLSPEDGLNSFNYSMQGYEDFHVSADLNENQSIESGNNERFSINGNIGQYDFVVTFGFPSDSSPYGRVDFQLMMPKSENPTVINYIRGTQFEQMTQDEHTIAAYFISLFMREVGIPDPYAGIN